MGGRGASSTLFFHKGNKIKPIYELNALGIAIPKTMRDALGNKTSISLESALSGSNPHYNPEFAAYSMNCQRAVVAYELRRRGYDVTALHTYQGDTLPRAVTIKGEAVLTSRWMGAFHGAKTDVVGARTRKKAEENLVNKMKSYGEGSRAIVRVQWNNKKGGHVFNAEYKNGKMLYRDAQTGEHVNIQHYLSMARPQSVGLIRTDNLKLSYRVRNFVTQTRR